MKKLAIASQKGGSGKTTLAIHLGVAATKDGLSVVILDLDEQASATVWHKARVTAGHDPYPYVQPTHTASLETVLEELERQAVDLVLIDTAPQSNNPAVKAAEVSDLVLITCRPSVMDLRAIQNTIRLTQLANVTPYVVLTQIEAYGTLHDEARQSLQGLGVDVLPSGLGRRVAYHHGLIDGRTALEYEPKGKAANEVQALYQHVSHLVCLSSSRQENEDVQQETTAA